MPADSQRPAAPGQDPPRLAHPAPADPSPAALGLAAGECDPEWDRLEQDDPFGDDADEPTGPTAWVPGPLRAIRAAFGLGHAADGMAPGAVLAGLAEQAWRHGLTSLDEDQLAGMLQAASRLTAWSAALRLAAVSQLAQRRTAAAEASGDRRALEHVKDEMAITLTLTNWSADRLLGLAVALDRLPLTQAALATGAIDERRADVIADELSGLDDKHVADVEARLFPRAAGQTTGELRKAARRAVLAANPAAAKRRKDKALQDARVETFTEAAGTAALAGRDLPPAKVLAADQNLTSLALDLRQAGADGTLDQLRARAYLHLLSGQPAGTLTDTSPGTPADPHQAHPGPAPARPEPTSDPASAAPVTSGQHNPGPVPPGLRGSIHPEPARPAMRGSIHPEPARPALRGSIHPEPARPAMRGTIHLTVPLATWLGWSASPGEVGGFGALDADDSRAVADMLAAHPATTWCITLTGLTGRPLAHGCTRTGPGPAATRAAAGAAARAGPGMTPPADPGATPRADPEMTPPADPETTPWASPGEPRGTGPPGLADWMNRVRIKPLQTQDCSHPREGRGYQPGPSLRHLVQVRNATCTAPGCRRPARQCDLDHTIPHQVGGRSCECNLGPLCRRHHQCKQLPGWTLTQASPGTFIWCTPSGRRYQTTPTEYPG